MTTIDNSSGSIMNASAALNNDAARSIYTYAAQLPYLNMALKELQEFFQLNAVAVTDATSAELEVEAGVTEIGFATATVQLPSDLVEIQQIWQSGDGDDAWVPMTKVNFLPVYLEGQTVQNF